MQSFDDVLSTVLRSAKLVPRQLGSGECQSSAGQRCTLCHAVNLDYAAELTLKNDALQTYWSSLNLGIPLDTLVASPLGRKYRTTTKRRVFHTRDSIRLGLIGPSDDGGVKPFDVVQCAIEPAEHAAIYQHVQESIAKPYARRLAPALQYVVIKGNYLEHTLILNLDEISPDVLRAANTISKTLTKRFPTIVGVFVFEGETNAQYYLGVKNPREAPRVKKLHGKSEIFLRACGRSFLYSPLSFSQINHSIVEQMIQIAGALLQPTKHARLFDFYCGYGLFTLALAEFVASAIGVELSFSAVESAIANARRQRVANARFIRSNIDRACIERVMKKSRPDDVVVLDPPRSGTAAGVIECIAARKAARVLHIFCAIDLIASELQRWRSSSYKPVRAVPLDLFPGTAAIETMVILEPVL